MRCFVTGASGFLGSNLVVELLRQNHRVVALVRKGSQLRGLEHPAVQRVVGHVGDRAGLESAMAGCDWCFHAAASYALWLPDYRPMFAANVEGTRNVLEAAVAARCARIVYTSTVGCLGLPRPGNGAHANEDTLVSEADMVNPYKKSKWRAERVALDLARAGAPVVVVNPSAPIGPRDVKPTPTGQIIVDFLNRRMPAFLDTGLNLVHVRDVATGHLRAAERGRIGERYILGNAEGNWTMAEAFKALERISGIPAPKLRIPHLLALLLAYCCEALAYLTRKPPKAPLGGVRMAKHKMFYSPAKAIRELGLPQTPPEEALADAVRWFRSNGYVR